MPVPRKRRQKGHVRWYSNWIATDAYKHLSGEAIKLATLILEHKWRQVSPPATTTTLPNGRIPISAVWAGEQLGKSTSQGAKYLRELCEKQFLVKVTTPAFRKTKNGKRVPAHQGPLSERVGHYRITVLPSEPDESVPATNEFLSWKPPSVSRCAVRGPTPTAGSSQSSVGSHNYKYDRPPQNDVNPTKLKELITPYKFEAFSFKSKQKADLNL